MTTKLSTKGQVVLPKAIRRKMDLRPGDQFDTSVERGCIVLTPKKRRNQKARLVKDPITGLLVVSAGKDAPPLTSEMVEEMLSDFP